ncbi:MAG: Mycothiol acetyltransferase [Phycisphaerae bacterium]|nr:Mycothiol acetyltransferase [Phycisphaerae bacterium]
MNEPAVESISIRMLRPHLRDLPDFPLPEGFALRLYRPGDVQSWLAIHHLAEFLIPREQMNQELFDKQFGYDLAAMESRCFFLVCPDGRDVGTATAWYDDDFFGRSIGRVHWVAIVPEFQGRGLAKPLMAAVLRRLAESHGRAYLSTNSPRIPAIRLYMDLGFAPWIATPEHARGWAQVRQRLSHPLLDAPPLTPREL